MSDALDRLAEEAAPLLLRVDAALADAGAPPDGEVWSLLRRVRALPSDAVAAVVGWRTEPLAQATTPLRTLARRYAEACDPIVADPQWEGAAADAFRLRSAALRAYVQGAGTDSLVGRLRATVSYLEELAGWMTRSRRRLAAALADVLGSAEAVTVLTGAPLSGPAVSRGAAPVGAAPVGAAAMGAAAVGAAAARIAAHLLAPVAVACDEARALHDDWQPRLGQLVHQPPRDPVATTGGRRLRIGE